MVKGRGVLILPVDEDGECVTVTHATWMGVGSGMGIFARAVNVGIGRMGAITKSVIVASQARASTIFRRE